MAQTARTAAKPAVARRSDARGPRTPGFDRRAGDCRLTILIPCLNEAETLEACIVKATGFLERSGTCGEVLVADNGSTDGSPAIALRLGARVVHVPSPGYGAALQGGILAARGRYVIMGDADDSYDFSKLGAFLAELESGAELVMGNRFRGGIAAGAMPFLHRYVGNPALSGIGRLLFRVPVRDFHCGLRGFHRESILRLDLKATGMEYASEMVVRASFGRLRIVEVPTTLDKDGRSRPPHLKTWRDGWRHLRFLLLHSPRWTFLYPGAALIGLGGVAAAAIAPAPLRLNAHLTLDVHSFLLACIAVLVGVQLVTFGVIASRYARRHGLTPPSRRRAALIDRVDLETMLQFAVVLFVAGLTGVGWAVWRWSLSGFGDLHDAPVLRVTIAASCAIASSVQLGFSAFLLGLLDLQVGDARSRQDFLRAVIESDATGG